MRLQNSVPKSRAFVENHFSAKLSERFPSLALLPKLMRKTIPSLAIIAALASCFSDASIAASMYNQKEAQMATAYAIESNRRLYEAESAASQAYLEASERIHNSARQAAHIDTDQFFWGHSRVGRPELDAVNLPPRQLASRPLGVELQDKSLEDESHGENSPATAPLLLEGNVSEVRVVPRRPRPSVLSLISSTEDKLIHLHDRNHIGSFDMDKFTERLLQIKKNFSVMSKQRQLLSSRQEEILRAEIAALSKDVHDRAGYR